MTESAATTAPLPRFALGEGTTAFEAAVEQARSEDWATRLFDRDTTLWSTDPRVQEAIVQRLGWLDAPEEFANRTASLEGFGDSISESGFATVVLGGMGGSSLAPDVFRRTFGSTEGYPELRILDSTDPEFVAATLDDLDPLSMLFIVASKSGTTTEPNAFLADAWARAEAAVHHDGGRRGTHPGELFVAITDPGKSLHEIHHSDTMREVFLNPPDIGGRYSALTYFGLVPATLIGLDLDALLGSAIAMVGACREPDAGVNPGVSLGLAIGTLAKNGRDKLTFLVDDEIESLGAWLEQLIAESTGKRGVGIVPVDSEPLGAVEAYGPDRAFVRIALDGGTAGSRDELAAALEAAGPSGDPDRHERSDRSRRGVLPLGGRHRDRRSGARHRPIRPAERGGGQGADATRADCDRHGRPGPPGHGAQLVGCAQRRGRGGPGRADPRRR